MQVKPYQNNKKSKNRNSKLIRILLGALCVLVIGAGVTGYILSGILTNDDAESLFIEKNDDNALAAFDTDSAIIAPNNEEAKLPEGTIEYNGKSFVKNENIVNILFLGIDTNTQRKIDRLGYRSDVVMVCAVDVKENKATLISIPRDTYTTVYKIDDDTCEIAEVVKDKINAAYSYGGGAKKYSYQNAMACVQLFLQRECDLEKQLDFTLDIPVNHYASIDMDGLPHIASAVGGVEVTLEKGLAGVGSKGDTVLLKYSSAEAYVRTRHGAGGDLDRARRQQKFMLALAKRIKDMGAVDIITSLYDDLQKYVSTKLTTTQMLDLAKVLMKTDINAIERITIQGEEKKIDGSSCILHDELATLDILLDVYYNEVP